MTAAYLVASRFKAWFSLAGHVGRWSTPRVFAPQLGLLLAVISWSTAAADLAATSWQWPNVTSVREQLQPWIDEQPLPDEQRAAIDAVWAPVLENDAGQELFDLMTRTVAIADPKLADWVRRCQAGAGPMSPETEFPAVDLSLYPPLVRNHLILLRARLLVWWQLYDEAAASLEPLTPQSVADPATLLFYRAAIQYRLRDREAGLATLAQLMEHESRLPQRFASVARLMQSDLKGYKPDSLDEVARLMDSVRIRLHHGRAGTRVRKEEDEVIAKLEKMIDDMEKQRQQMQAAAAGASGNQSSNPASDSMLPGGGGQGDVDSRSLGDDTDWGDLPPKAREEALQQLGEDYPSHYREVIEEYFRNLAQEGAGP